MSKSSDNSGTTLTVEAQAWLSQLPGPVRAHGLALYAPVIANRLAVAWRDGVPAAAEMLEKLLVEGERTLPHELAAELLRLYEYHARCQGADAPSTTWELPVSGMHDLPRGMSQGRRA